MLCHNTGMQKKENTNEKASAPSEAVQQCPACGAYRLKSEPRCLNQVCPARYATKASVKRILDQAKKLHNRPASENGGEQPAIVASKDSALYEFVKKSYPSQQLVEPLPLTDQEDKPRYIDTRAPLEQERDVFRAAYIKALGERDAARAHAERLAAALRNMLEGNTPQAYRNAQAALAGWEASIMSKNKATNAAAKKAAGAPVAEAGQQRYKFGRVSVTIGKEGGSQ